MVSNTPGERDEFVVLYRSWVTVTITGQSIVNPQTPPAVTYDFGGNNANFQKINQKEKIKLSFALSTANIDTYIVEFPNKLSDDTYPALAT